MYRIFYEEGNGYHCGCCRQTWNEHIDFNTEEEVILWLSNLEADQKTEGKDIDISVNEIREIKDEELYISADPKIVESILQKRKEEKEAKERKEKRREERNKKARELGMLKKLKEKYEGDK